MITTLEEFRLFESMQSNFKDIKRYTTVKMYWIMKL